MANHKLFIPFPVIGDDKLDNETATQLFVASTLSSVSKQTPVLLKCVKVNIFNPQNLKQKYEVLVLLNNENSVTYISKGLAKKLRLPSQGREFLEFGVFRNPQSRQAQFKRIKLLITIQDEFLTLITANTTSYLTQPVSHC